MIQLESKQVTSSHSGKTSTRYVLKKSYVNIDGEQKVRAITLSIRELKEVAEICSREVGFLAIENIS